MSIQLKLVSESVYTEQQVFRKYSREGWAYEI